MPERIEPNIFELTGPKTRVTYTTSGLGGGPVFSYDGPEGNESFDGDSIERARTVLGSEVTVTLSVVFDGDRVTATLVVPDVSLPDAQTQPISTVVIVTTNRSTIAGPPDGAAQFYKVVPLEGNASFVKA